MLETAAPATVNARDRCGRTALFFSAAAGHPQVLLWRPAAATATPTAPLPPAPALFCDCCADSDSLNISPWVLRALQLSHGILMWHAAALCRICPIVSSLRSILFF